MSASEPAPARAEARDRSLAATIERRLADEAGIYAAVRVEGGVAYLDGIVESAEQRDAATDLVGRVPGVARVQNDLDVEEFGALPAAPGGADEQQDEVEYEMLDGEPVPEAEPLESDFNDPIPVVGSDVTRDSMLASEEGIPYVPPTDPVVRPVDNEEGLEVVGGLSNTAMDEFPDDLETTALGEAPPGDEDLETRVLEELAADAETTDLLIEVAVSNGVVRLRGRVQSLEEAEAAEAVAARVPGVREVVEELEVAALEE